MGNWRPVAAAIQAYTDSTRNQDTSLEWNIKKFAINIGLINFKGDMVEIKMNIPYKFENTQEALEELCALIRNFIKGTEINDKKIMNICINISGRVNPESGYSFSMFNFFRASFGGCTE